MKDPRLHASGKLLASLLLLASPAVQAQAFPATVNPKLVLTAVPNSSFAPNMGLGFLSDGRMVFLASDTGTAGVNGGSGKMGQGYIMPASAKNAVYLGSGLSASGSLSGVTFTKILDSLTGPPPGVTVVNDTVYVGDRDGFYRVKSLAPAATARSKNAVRLIKMITTDSNFTWNRGPTGHQWPFTPQYYKGRFYAPYSGSIIPGGYSGAPPTSTFSGSILSWAKDSIVPDNAPANAGYTKEAGGQRSPNGMGMGPNGEYMVYADNQGSFNPGCPMHIFRPGQPLVTYGTRQGTATNAGGAASGQINGNTKRNWAEDLPYQPPLIWVPYSPSASASQPLYLTFGPYKGHWIIGDVNTSGMGRFFIDNVDTSGHYQASYHLFAGTGINSTGTTEGKAINRMAISPDSAVYVGTVLKIGNWPTGNPGPVFRMTFKDTSIFEILAVRSRKSADGTANGIEVFFSQPIDPTTVTAASFALQQNNFLLSANYGTNSQNFFQKTPTVSGISFSNDNRKVFVAISTPDTSIGAAHIGKLGVGNNPTGVWGGPGEQDRVLRVTVDTTARSASGATLFHRIAWMGWFYQANTRFDPANSDLAPLANPVSIRPGKGSGRLAATVDVRAVAGALEVRLYDGPAATVSVYGVDGKLVAERSGSGVVRFEAGALSRGLHVLRVRQGKEAYTRSVML
ncbi:MAG TPA: hypothetical protein VHO02_03010 [Fibrobacteria bacterium]|nr:hypothetical protein [Fibrobacteria bacterium]